MNNEIGRPRLLDSFPILRSRNTEEIRQALIRAYGARYLDLLSGAGGSDFRTNQWQSQNIAQSYCSFGMPLQLEFPSADFFRLAFVRGGADIRLGRFERQVTDEETCVVPPEELVTATFKPSFEHFGLRIKADFLLSKLAALMGVMPSRKLVFDQTTRADSRAIGNLQRTLMFFAAELDALGSEMPSLAVAELERALIVSLYLRQFAQL
jgi:hypothetical protein